MLDAASPRCTGAASPAPADPSLLAPLLAPSLLEQPLPKTTAPANKAPNATINRGWKCLWNMGGRASEE
jgi:hypothetical protein